MIKPKVKIIWLMKPSKVIEPELLIPELLTLCIPKTIWIPYIPLQISGTEIDLDSSCGGTLIEL
jgi:hypothetical protein